MAIEHLAYQLALRARALTLSVCTTGTMALAATSTGFTRATGSFATDGFYAGMEITPAGFADAINTPCVVTNVSALLLTVNRRQAAQASAGSRSIAVGLPAQRAWENVRFQPKIGVPYVAEMYRPGPAPFNATAGDGGEIEVRPEYMLQVYVPTNTDMSAAAAYADALLAHFGPPNTITLLSGELLRPRTEVRTNRGQFQTTENGFGVVPVSVFFWVRTTNT